MEAFEEPNEGEDKENDRKEFQPLVGEHAGDLVVWSNEHVSAMGHKFDREATIVRCGFYGRPNCALDLLEIPPIEFLRQREHKKSLEMQLWLAFS